MKLVKVIEQAGREWNQSHPDGPRIGVGDMSLEDGGQFCWCTWIDLLLGRCDAAHHKCHEGHQQGLNADLRYVRDDGAEANFTFSANNPGNVGYSQAFNQELVNFLCDAGVDYIYADDRSGLTGHQGCNISDYPGHSNHFHIHITP